MSSSIGSTAHLGSGPTNRQLASLVLVHRQRRKIQPVYGQLVVSTSSHSSIIDLSNQGYRHQPVATQIPHYAEWAPVHQMKIEPGTNEFYFSYCQLIHFFIFSNFYNGYGMKYVWVNFGIHGCSIQKPTSSIQTDDILFITSVAWREV